MSVDRARLPDGYAALRFLGQGGNGYVVCARDIALDRLVAVKLVLGGTLAAGGVSRLRREGQALASLDHPHVVRVHAAVPLGDDLALVMEFVDGPSLSEALKRETLDSAQTLVVLEDVARALEHCARRGVVHRDLKPGNVLVTPEGRGKVADFGLARLSRVAAAYRSSPGIVSGTVAYMAPEQVTDPDHEHPASDAYSFAVLCCFALTGRYPPEALGRWTGPAASCIAAALSEDPEARPTPTALISTLGAVRLPQRARFSGAAVAVDATQTSGTTPVASYGVRQVADVPGERA